VPGYQSVAWYGLVGPKGMPTDILKKISEAVIKAADTSAVKAVVATQGGDVVASTPQEFADFIQAERARYAPIVREAGMMVE
jgi:tripartite-type tricarboxylate transporter receptor subunit TctC